MLLLTITVVILNPERMADVSTVYLYINVSVHISHTNYWLFDSLYELIS